MATIKVGDIVEATGDQWSSIALGTKGVVKSITYNKMYDRYVYEVQLIEPMKAALRDPFPVGHKWYLEGTCWKLVSRRKSCYCKSLL